MARREFEFYHSSGLMVKVVVVMVMEVTVEVDGRPGSDGEVETTARSTRSSNIAFPFCSSVCDSVGAFTEYVC